MSACPLKLHNPIIKTNKLLTFNHKVKSLSLAIKYIQGQLILLCPFMLDYVFAMIYCVHVNLKKRI